MREDRDLRIVLAIDTHEERTALEMILVRVGYAVRHASTVDEVAAPVFTRGPVGVVFSVNRLPDGRSWRDVLARLQELPHPPPLIVADRLADEALWAEVLNLGAYDLLIEPLDPTEVGRVVGLAWSAWETSGAQVQVRARKQSGSEFGAG